MCVVGIMCVFVILSYVIFGVLFIECIFMVVLMGMMLCLVFDIFDWTSFSRVKKIFKIDVVVLLFVIGVIVVINLVVVVFVGVVLFVFGFVWKFF